MVVIFLHREYYERSLKIREKFYGRKHASVATVLGNLAILWEKEGDKAKAISHYQEILAIQEEILGPNHLEVSLCDQNFNVTIPNAKQICQQARASSARFRELLCTRV